MPPPEPPGTIRILPMQLQVGDRFSDESSEWEVIGDRTPPQVARLLTFASERVDKPGVTETRSVGLVRADHRDTTGDRGGQPMMPAPPTSQPYVQGQTFGNRSAR